MIRIKSKLRITITSISDNKQSIRITKIDKNNNIHRYHASLLIRISYNPHCTMRVLWIVWIISGYKSCRIDSQCP